VRKHKINRLSSPWLALILIALVAAVIYSNIYNSPFVFDDKWQIVEKTSIRHLGNYLSFEQLLKPRAIVDLTFAINYKFGKLNVFGFHLINVLIHIINGFIVYFLALIIFKQLSVSPIPQSSIVQPSQHPTIQSSNHPVNFSPPHPLTLSPSQQISFISLFAALIFVAHPIQTQAVTYTIQRYASVAAMFYMASVLFYLKARIEAESSKWKAQSGKLKAQSRKLKAKRITHEAQRINDRGGRSILSAFSFELSALYSLSIFCGMLAFLSKQNTASLPGAILLVEYLFVDRTWQGWKRKIPWFAVAFTLWLLFVFYVSGFFGGVGGSAETGLLEDVSGLMQETDTVSRWSYLCTQFNVLVIYIRLLFLPVGQNLDYLYSFKSGFFDGYTSLAFLFLAGIAALGIWNIKKRPVIAFAIFWFFITLSVESSIIPIRDALFEHRLYLAMFGFALLIPYLIFHFLSTKRMLVAAVSVLIIASFGTATFLRNIAWQNEISIWSDIVSKSQENYRALNNWGSALLWIDKPDEAIKKLKRALTLRPDYSEALNNWGSALSKIGKMEKAIQKHKQALSIQPYNFKAWYNWAYVLIQINDPDEAIAKLQKVISIKPDYAKAWGNLGGAYLLKGKIEEAVEASKRAVSLEPEYSEALCNLGIALGKAGMSEEAIQKFKKAGTIDPNNAQIWKNWGYALELMNKPAEAIKKFERSISINPDDAKVWDKCGIALLKTGRSSEAIVKFERAVSIKPDYSEALCHWGVALGMKGRLEEAVSKFEKAATIKPDYIDVWSNWGNALVKMKRFEDAVKKYEKALSLNPEMPNVRKTLLEIKRIMETRKNQ